ncbi:MAG: hypothetical protein WCD53_28350 [Microcoleus sp.]
MEGRSLFLRERAIALYQCRGDQIGHENIAIAICWWGWGGFINLSMGVKYLGEPNLQGL